MGGGSSRVCACEGSWVDLLGMKGEEGAWHLYTISLGIFCVSCGMLNSLIIKIIIVVL